MTTMNELKLTPSEASPLGFGVYASRDAAVAAEPDTMAKIAALGDDVDIRPAWHPVLGPILETTPRGAAVVTAYQKSSRRQPPLALIPSLNAFLAILDRVLRAYMDATPGDDVRGNVFGLCFATGYLLTLTELIARDLATKGAPTFAEACAQVCAIGSDAGAIMEQASKTGCAPGSSVFARDIERPEDLLGLLLSKARTDGPAQG